MEAFFEGALESFWVNGSASQPPGIVYWDLLDNITKIVTVKLRRSKDMREDTNLSDLFH